MKITDKTPIVIEPRIEPIELSKIGIASALFLVKPSIKRVNAVTLWLIVAGGISYTLGTYFIYNDTVIKYYHAIWHLFVLGGSLMHWTAILFSVQKGRNA